MYFKTISFVAVLMFTICRSSASPVSSQIAYQGILTDTKMNALRDSTYVLFFGIDTSLTTGSSIWTESQAVATKNGVFNIMLGSVTSLDTLAFDKQYWLTVKRDNGAPIGTKLKLNAVPYAKRALLADSATKAYSASIAKIADTALTVATNSHLKVAGLHSTEEIYSNNKSITHRAGDTAQGLKKKEFVGFQNFGIVCHGDSEVASDTSTISSFAGNRELSIVSISNANTNAAALTIPKGRFGIGTIQPQNKVHIIENSQKELLEQEDGVPLSNLLLEGRSTSRKIGTGPSLTFALAADTFGNNTWTQARILATPDNSKNNNAEGRLYLQVRKNTGSSVVWNWHSSIILSATGPQGLGTTSINGNLQANNIQEFSDNAAAIAAGLPNGTFYRTGDLLKVVHP
jgi:hypothetical protein